MRRAILFSIFSVALFGAVAARAEHTRFWEQSSFAEFEKGTHKGVALRSDGTLIPAPEFKPFTDPNLAYLWALAVDSHGRVYAAGGSDAKVLRLDDSGKPATVFESTELTAQALAIDKQDNVYVATSPDGKVYKISSDGKHTVFFDPKTKYIWALAFDSAGTLFVATGDKGEVFAVGPDGTGKLFFKSDESHARSLAFDHDGNLLVGTDPSGLIIRVPFHAASASALPQAGKAFVIYETDKKEVTSLAADSSGNIYAAAVGNKTPRQQRIGVNPAAAQQLAAAFQAAAARSAAATAAQSPTVGTPSATPMIFPQFPSATGGSEVYRIAPDGSPESLWSSPQDVVYALGFSPENHLLLGTGNHGEVIELTDNQMFSSLASADASQVTSLATGPGHRVYVATANPGKVFTLGPEYAAEGTFESDPFDAKIYSRWGRLTWWGEHDGAAGKVEFYVRSGNTSDPDDYWSPWSGPFSDASGNDVHCPPARFVQWKAVFHIAGQHSVGQDAHQQQPTLAWVKLAYLRNNVAPVIDGIVVEQPGLRAQGFAGGGVGPQQPPSVVPLRVPETHEDGETNFSNVTEFQQQHSQRFTPPPQGFSAKGYQTAVWTAHDENDDELTFSLYYRGQGEKEWKLLKNDISEDFYSWDTNLMPDGAYYLKLVASDSASNPSGQALTADLISDRFQVDNTPPSVENLRAQPSGNEWHLRFTARDTASDIARSSYSVDAHHWQSVFPEGQLTDAPVENYDVVLHDLKPGEHTVAVQVFDQFENSAASKVTFTVPPSTH
ncbi:MAG TPA: hypothetical protein VKT50_06435 [Candidatus Acidoferrales bacterium]|nr:hypothetical protein [Candidatus Acidoferrales bacterium]